MLLMLIVSLVLVNMPNISFADEWVKKADMPTATLAFGSVVVNNMIYCTAGLSKGGRLKSTNTYDPIKDIWIQKANMNTERFVHSCVELNRKIYVCGGMLLDGANTISSVEEYDPVNDIWIIKQDMPVQKGLHATAVLDGKIYVIGGYKQGATQNDVYAYDPIADKWGKKHDLPFPFDTAQACSWNGWTLSRAVFTYDPKKDSWVEKTDMPTPSVGFSLSIVNNNIYVIGGHSAEGTISVINVYDPVKKIWTDDQINMTAGRSFLGSQTVDNKIYVMGGSDFFDGLGNLRNILSIVEEYTPDINFLVMPKDSISSTWGSIKTGN
jgi:N-acetylneuraminic acid mutarotase